MHDGGSSTIPEEVTTSYRNIHKEYLEAEMSNIAIDLTHIKKLISQKYPPDLIQDRLTFLVNNCNKIKDESIEGNL